MRKMHLSRTKLLIAVFFTAASLWGTELEVSIGEQPPLLSSAGGIVDLAVTKALRLGGYEVRYKWLPIGRMLAGLRDDQLNVYVTPSNTPGQQHPHIDVLEARGVFFYKKSKFRADPVARLEDLAGKRVATVINSPLRPMLEGVGAIVDEGPFETMFLKLDSGRVDFTATADVGGILSIREKFPGRENEFSFTDFSYSKIRAGLYVKDRAELKGILTAFRKGLERMKSDGSLKKMLIDFFGEENWRRVKIL